MRYCYFTTLYDTYDDYSIMRVEIKSKLYSICINIRVCINPYTHRTCLDVCDIKCHKIALYVVATRVYYKYTSILNNVVSNLFSVATNSTLTT